MTKQEGDRKICPECNIEIHVKKIKFQGEERLSWRNPDGTAHFDPVENPDKTITFVHVPTVKTPLEVWQQEIEERIARIERTSGIIIGE